MEVKFKHVQTFVETQVKETNTLIMEKRKEREGQDTSITQMVVTVQERLDSEVAKLSEKIQQLLEEQTKVNIERVIANTTNMNK